MDKDRIKKFKEFQKAFQEMTDSDGYKINSSNKESEFVFNIYAVNFVKLKIYLENIPAPDHRDHKMRDKIFVEIGRRLMNFISSGFTLIDHFRLVIRERYGEEHPFYQEYNKKIEDEFVNDGLHNFMKFLRNYILHGNIPPLSITMKLYDARPKNEALLTKKTLLHSKWCKSISRKYTEEYRGDIAILDVCEKYFEKNIFLWYMKKQGEIHRDEFKDFKKKQVIAQKLQDGL